MNHEFTLVIIILLSAFLSEAFVTTIIYFEQVFLKHDITYYGLFFFAVMSYTCISCRVQFCDGEVQRAHYKTDWHRYNLKRKVAEMPPVTAENFQDRVLAQRAALEQQSQASGHSSTYCATCNKKFSSDNAYSNHIQSNKHQQAEKKALAAAQDAVQRMNEKNLEKGAGLEKDVQNEALQKALKEQQRPAPFKATPTEKLVRQRPEKSPRLEWFVLQAKKIAAEEGEIEEAEEGKNRWQCCF